MQAAGYQTAIVGKWHLVSDPTGFDYWEILPGQGVYYNPPMIRNGQRVKHDGYVTDIITDLALDWLKERDKSKPFLLMCQHKAPHRDWEPALKYLGHDDDRQYPVPATLFDDYSGRGKAEHEQDMTIAKTMNDHGPEARRRRRSSPPEQLQGLGRLLRAAQRGLPQGQPRRATTWCAGSTTATCTTTWAASSRSTRASGRLLKYLDDEGLAENTIVVYASDQGFYLGEHGWFDKRWIFEESLRTPLLVRWPGVVKPGSVNRDMVSNLDFAETFLDAAGVPVPAEMQGRSLVPVLQGPDAGRLAQELLLPLLRVPRPAQRAPGTTAWSPTATSWSTSTSRSSTTGSSSIWRRTRSELTSVYGQPEYAQVQKELEAELARLRKDLKVPDKDPPETMIKSGPAKAKAKTKAKPKAKANAKSTP